MMHRAPTKMMTVLPRVAAIMGSVLHPPKSTPPKSAPAKSTQRRQLLAAISEMQRSLWLLECNLKPKDQLALLESLEATADEVDRLLK